MPPISLSSLQSSIDTLTTDTAQIDAIRAYLRLLGPVQERILAPSDPQAPAWFGCSVSINAAGDVAIIGAYGDDGSDSGAAYIFTNSGSGWTETAKLVPSDPETSAYFGYSVSINAAGDVAIIGAYYDDGTGAVDSGAAYIFSNSGGSWSQVTKLLPSDPEASATFGTTVSINAAGDVAIIGAKSDDGAGTLNSGAAYIFSNSGGGWTQVAKLLPSDPEANAYFGGSVSINAAGDVAIIGAYADDGYRGAAYIFTNSGGWSETVKLLPSDPEVDAVFGYSVSINAAGDVAIIGAYGDDEAGAVNSGAAYIFTNSGGWSQVAKLLPSDPETSANFGIDVSINAAGDVAIIGAYYDDGIGVADSGAAYVFTNSGGSWSQVAKLLPSDPEASAAFGDTVSINAAGNMMIIGAPYRGFSGTMSGVGYIFRGVI